MKTFEEIHEKAELLSGTEKLTNRMPRPKTNGELCKASDSEYLSLMSRRIFRAGLKHSMVDAKWSAFEKVFSEFDIEAVRMMSDEAMEALMRDKSIIRHWGKIKSVRANATTVHEILNEYECFGEYLASWNPDNIVSLWDELKKRFAQMGGNSGAYFLRMAGKDTFLLTKDVIRALNNWGAYQGEPKTRKARKQVQEIFNKWSEESDLPLSHISMTLALSVE